MELVVVDRVASALDENNDVEELVLYEVDVVDPIAGIRDEELKLLAVSTMDEELEELLWGTARFTEGTHRQNPLPVPRAQMDGQF